MNKSFIKIHVKGSKKAPEFNVRKVLAISENETQQRANSDPDAPIVDPRKLKRVYKINRRK